jgi:membrane protease YdiL (CAAX protease family)
VWEVVLLLALFFAAQLLFSGLAVALVRAWLPGQAAEDELITLVRYSLPSGLLASYILVAVAVYGLLVKRHRVPIRASLKLLHVPLRSLAGPFAGGVALQFLTALLVAVTPPPEDKQFIFDLFLKSGTWSLAFFFVVAVGMAPLLEEVLFRGMLLPALSPRVGFVRAALLVTLLFTALHGFQVGLYWPALAGIFLCGWILAWLRQRSGTLWPSVAFHIGFNFTAFLPVLLLGENLA